MGTIGEDGKLTKLEFSIESTSEDADYPVQELLRQSPETRGWQSSKHCTYPQEIILRFDSFVRVKQIQILCHEFKICSRMEISSGVLTTAQSEQEENIDWKRLGTLSFDTNERSGFLARELKSVYVTAEGDLMKLRLFQCHPNKLNTYRQIAIVAINVEGDLLVDAPPADAIADARSTQSSGQPAPPADQISNGGSKSDVFDAKTSMELQNLQRLKEIAVANEDYDEAKRLKIQVDSLRGVGKRLAQLEEQKRAAVREEDYDLAKQLKSQIEQVRQAFQAENGQQVTSDAKDASAKPLRNQQLQHDAFSATILNANPKSNFSEANEIANEINKDPASIATKGDVQRSSSLGRSKHEEYDNRVTKGQAHYDEHVRETIPSVSATETPSESPSRAPDGFPADLASPEPLTAANAKAAQPLEQFAGEYVAQCFYSRTWQLREAAVVYLQSHLNSLVQPTQEREHFRLLCHVVVKGLKDKVANVFLTSTSLIQSLISEPWAHAKDIQFATAEFIPLLIDKLGESNPRLRDAAHESILILARQKENGVKNMAGSFLRPLKKQAAWRPVLGRLEIVSELLDLIGVSRNATSGFDLDQMMQFVGKAYTSPNADVRSAAIALTVKVAHSVGPVVRKYIPEDVNHKIREQLDQEIAAALSSPASQTTPVSKTVARTKIDSQTTTSPVSQASPASIALQSEGEDPAVIDLELQKQEQLLGQRHPDLTEILTQLAAVYTQREEYDRAYPLLKRALDINESHFGPEHSNVAHALTDLAVLHMEQGQDEQGRPLLEKALAIQENNLGADHPDVVAIRDVLSSSDD